MNTALEYYTRVAQEGGRRCKKSTLNDLVHLTPLRISLMNPPNGCKNYLRPFNSDVLYRPLCEDIDKIPEGRTSTYILHLSGST
jgi:hypothetical protein